MEQPQNVPNYLVQAILVTIFCCLPFGIVGIVFAAQVNGKLSAGDYQGAVQASQNAKKWTMLGFWIGLGINLLVLAFQIIMIIGAAGAAGAGGGNF